MINAHCHCHCRRDPRISKDFKDWIGAKTQPASRDLLGPGASHEPILVGDLLRFPPGLLVLSVKAVCSGLRSSYFSFLAWNPGGSLRLSKFMCATKGCNQNEKNVSIRALPELPKPPPHPPIRATFPTFSAVATIDETFSLSKKSAQKNSGKGKPPPQFGQCPN